MRVELIRRGRAERSVHFNSNLRHAYLQIPPKTRTLATARIRRAKAYSKVKQGGHGTLLIDLLGQSFTTGSADLHSHFLMASETLRGCGETVAAQRLSEIWAVVQRTLPPLEMQRKYLMEYIRKYAGRGIPVMIDKDLVMLVLAVYTVQGS